MRWARAIAAAALVAAAPGCSCGDNAPGADAAAVTGDGGRLYDASVGPDAIAPLIWIDFAITGCGEPVPGGDADAGPEGACHGGAPLALEFVPIAPATVDVYEWTFGDGSDPDGRATPRHVYGAPGVYDVTLSAQGPGGTAGLTRTAAVIVGPAGLGAPCDADGDCASDLCVCEGGCDAFATGFCAAPCGEGAPCEAGACASIQPSGPEEWQATLCLPSCEEDACGAGTVCRELPRGDEPGWVSACFAPGLLGDIGDSCVDASGARDDDLCAGDLCLAAGQRGLCSAACADAPCPASAACATFDGDPAPVCLARCDADTACDSDPHLACTQLGFTVDEPPAPDGYCAPKPCETPADCGLTGSCTMGFCAP